MTQQDRIKRARAIIKDFERSRFLFGIDWRTITKPIGEIGLHVEGGNRFQLPFYHVTIEDESGLYALSFARHCDELSKRATAFKFWEEKRIGDSSNQVLQKQRQRKCETMNKLHPIQKFETFTPSDYQANILTWLENGQGNAIVNAVAGSGKSTTLVWLAQYLETGLFLAFNSHIARELGEKLTGTNVKAQTIHSLGYAILRKAYPRCNKVNGDKYFYLAGDWLDLVFDLNKEASTHEVTQAKQALPVGYLQELGERFTVGDKIDGQALVQFKVALKNACDKARLTLCDYHDPDALQAVCWQYDINLQESDLPFVALLLDKGMAQALDNGVIDFTDQLYIPVVKDLPPAYTYPFVMIDECQDLSNLQLMLVSKVVAPNGRVLAVGDPAQSMYGFAGAAFDSFWQVKAHFNCVELPLSVCYRCGTEVLALARHIVPHILARPNAPKGNVVTLPDMESLDTTMLLNALRDDQKVLIVCRLTAPLVSLAVQLIRNKIPATIRGQDIGKNLISILDKVAKMKGFTFDRVGYWLDEYLLREIEKLNRKKNSETQKQVITDKIEALKICATSFDVYDIPSLKAEIEALFSSEVNKVILSTIHRVKGDEADLVVILRPDKLPLEFPGLTEDQSAQEKNIAYVAITRCLAEGTLYIVKHDGKGLDMGKLGGGSIVSMPDDELETLAEIENESLEYRDSLDALGELCPTCGNGYGIHGPCPDCDECVKCCEKQDYCKAHPAIVNELGPEEIAITEAVLGVKIAPNRDLCPKCGKPYLYKSVLDYGFPDYDFVRYGHTQKAADPTRADTQEDIDFCTIRIDPHFKPDVPAILSNKLGVPVTVAEPPAPSDAPYYELIQNGGTVVQQSLSKPKWTLADFKEFALFKSEAFPGLWSVYERTPQGNKYLWSCADGHDSLIYKPREWADLPTLPDEPAPAVEIISTVDSSPKQLPLLAEVAPMPPTHTAHIPTPRGAMRAGGLIIKHTATSALTLVSIALLSTLVKG